MHNYVDNCAKVILQRNQKKLWNAHSSSLTTEQCYSKKKRTNEFILRQCSTLILFCDGISYKHAILLSMKSFHEGENRKKYYIFPFMILFSRISLCLYKLKRLLIKYLFKISTEGGQSISRDYKFSTKMVIKSAAQVIFNPTWKSSMISM